MAAGLKSIGVASANSNSSREDSRIDEARALVDAYLAEAAAQTGYPWDLKPDQLKSGRLFSTLSQDQIAACVVVALRRLIAGAEQRPEMPKVYELRGLIPMLYKRRPAFTERDLCDIFDAMAASRMTWRSWVPVQSTARAIDRWRAGEPLSDPARASLRRLCESANAHHLYADERKGLDLLQRMQDDELVEQPLLDLSDDWGAAGNNLLSAMDPATAPGWTALLRYAATAVASKPSASWVKAAKLQVDMLREEDFKALAATWLLLMRRPASGLTRIGPDGHLVPATLITEQNATIIRGVAWMCGAFDDRALAAAVADATVACFKKIPEIGARCVRGGNGCIYALGAMPGVDGAAQLIRLQQRITYSQAQRAIETALESAANRSGLSRDDLADLSVPTFGLEDGPIRREFGICSAELAIQPDGTTSLSWSDADGKSRKSEPVAVKREHPGEVKALKRIASDIEAMIASQRLRLERLMMTDRSWSYASWQERLLDHPLLAVLTRRLLWSFSTSEATTIGGWLDGTIVDANNAGLALELPNTTVRLFNPVLETADTTRAWQLWLERNRVTQPFKQAHREIYRLTEAERAAEHHSARFGGHILRQHQLAALCKQRGWSYRLQSSLFDSGNIPTLELPVSGWRATLDVEPIDSDEHISAAGISLLVTTGHVTFIDSRSRPVPLAEIPVALFSEFMRDVDLFVAVAGLGSDPTWDNRRRDRFGAYWRDAAFGDLNQSAVARRELLERLVPALAIASRCSFDDRFLIVRGDLRTHRIHLGSGNVQMEPNAEYLCIVKPGWEGNERIYLPFEGDSVLALILSKAFLLANDRAISDPTILRQIVGR